MKKVTDKSHARLGPSGWDWWSSCPGAPSMTDGLPNTSNAYAAEGTVAHEIADKVLSGEIADPAEELGNMYQVDGFDIEVDQEMVDSVNQYVSLVHDLTGDGTLMPEQQVPIGHLTGETGAEGTSDAIIISADGKKMTVVDLKYGKGVRVNAEGNGQARLYALGALHKFGMVYDEIEEVEVVICHPRLEEGTTSESLNIGELEEFKDEVEIAAGRVEIADIDFVNEPTELFVGTHLNPGEKQCRFCDAAGTCPALKAWTSNQLQLVSDVTAEDFADLTVPKQASSINVRPDTPSNKLAEFLRAVPLIEEAIKAVRAEVERRLFAGEEIPGFYLGVGRAGNRKWSDEEAVRKAIIKRGRLTKDQAFEMKLISPTTAEKLLGKDVMKLLAKDGLITQTEGKPSVCQDGDKNPVYVPVTAEDFADLTASSEADALLS